MKSIYEIEKDMKSSSRYPYTYACDWLRSCGLSESRSDASRLYSNEAEAKIFADMYVAYFSTSEYIDKFRQHLANKTLRTLEAKG